MQNELLAYIDGNNLCSRTDHILLTVSGGIDSVVMVHLMIGSGYRCAIAHCNFRLRGQESDEDEGFVRELATRYGLDIHVRSFDTAAYAESQGISLQMAARQLRYEWFEQIRSSSGYDLIATAHNRDDIIETFIINLTRGTGIRGLTGIKPRSGHLIRPLLFATRDQIDEYARVREILYREDSSNISTKYIRNKIRHDIIPRLEEINPGFRQGIINTIEKLHNTGIIYKKEINRIKKELLTRKGQNMLVSIAGLKQLSHPGIFLYEMLSDFDFNARTVGDIENCLDGPPGKQFYSDTHRLVKDREHLIISPRSGKGRKKYYIDEGITGITEPLRLEIKTLEHTSRFRIPRGKNTACLDHNRLIFPLILRKWHPGDYFYPLGMTHMKKISDFFVDEKLSLIEKENTWLLLSGEHIAWVVGHRIDDRYKITGKTRKICLARLCGH